MHSKLCVISGSSRDTLHIFPEPNKHIDRFNGWVAAVGGEMLGMDKDYIYRNRRICHKHFETKYHNRYGKLNRLAVPKLFLGDGAPPVNHLMDHDYLQVHLNPGPGGTHAMDGTYYFYTQTIFRCLRILETFISNMTPPPTKKAKYHFWIWNTDLVRDAPEIFHDYDLASDDEDDVGSWKCSRVIEPAGWSSKSEGFPAARNLGLSLR